MGLLFLIIGSIQFFFPKKMVSLYNNKKIKNVKQYLKVEGLTMLICGFILTIFGITSFIIEADLFFSLIFTLVIVFFFLSDYLCQKKLVQAD